MADEKSSLPTHRQCTFQFKNHSNIALYSPRVHIESGTCEEPLLPFFCPSESGSALFKKTPHTACGSVGVLTYDLQTECGQLMEEKMAVMFSNPYDFNIHSNWFAVGFFDMSRDCNSSLFHEMYNKSGSNFVRGKAGVHSLTYKGQSATIHASMSDSYTPIIKVVVTNN